MAAEAKKAGPATARQRARAAKAKLDAQRAQRDKRIEDQAVTWYGLVDQISDAQAAIATARAAQAAVVGALTGEDVTVDQAAALLGIDAGEVRALRKEHRATADTTDGAGDTAAREVDTAAGQAVAADSEPDAIAS